jgi:hypothetical protein
MCAAIDNDNTGAAFAGAEMGVASTVTNDIAMMQYH